MASGKRILIACELGADDRHLARLAPIATGLAAMGHQITLVLRLTAPARALTDRHGWDLLVAPAWRISPPPGFIGSTFADVLLQSGYSGLEALQDLLAGWRTLFDRVAPDLLIADFSPTAMLAARIAGLPTAAVGDGYALPPLTNPLPNLRPWAEVSPAQIADAEGRVVAIVNAALATLRQPVIAGLADIFAGVPSFLCTFQELDHYADRGAADYYGQIFDDGAGAAPAWPTGTVERVFASIDGRHPAMGAMLSALEALGLPSLVQASHLDPAAEVPLSRPNVRVVTQRVDRDAAIAGSDVVICQELITVAPALLAGRPVLLFPLPVEQMMVLHRVATQGYGQGVPVDATAATVNAALRRLLDDSGCRLHAASFARSYDGYRPAMAVEAIVEEIAALPALADGTPAG